MPQLILHPWFLVFLFTWLSFLILTPNKVLSCTFLNGFALPLPSHQALYTSWSWPWQ